ncbi:ash family protein [Salmonella enterica]|nr:ash family protein [Salmonella enterica]EHM6196446.1 ash family protein [Salmonella enterica]
MVALVGQSKDWPVCALTGIANPA